MIEILSYKQIGKNALEGILNIKIPKWGNFIIRDVSYFKKGSNRWISFPSRSYESDGQTKYFSYNLFEDKQTMETFRDKVFESLDKYIQENSNQVQQVKNYTDEVPF